MRRLMAFVPIVLVAVGGPARATFLSIEEAAERLVVVDAGTGEATLVDPGASVGFDSASLAYQPGSGVLYGLAMGRVLTIDPASGAG